MAMPSYSRPHFHAFAITSCSRRSELRRALGNAFVHYTRFCEGLLRHQQNWARLVFFPDEDSDYKDNGAFEDVALVFQIYLCLHRPELWSLETLVARDTPVFIYTSQELLRWFIKNQCISPPDGGPALACMVPPDFNDISLQQMASAHDRALPGGRYSGAEAVECFVAIQLSNHFAAGHTDTVRARDGSERACRFFYRILNFGSPYDIVAFGQAQFYDEFRLPTIPEASSCCVDLLYDYEVFLQEGETLDGIARYPKYKVPPKVAIVGSGLSGLVAATELLRSGVEDITIFASADTGDDDASPAIANADYAYLAAKFGVMCCSATPTCLSRYLNKFRIATQAPFPPLGLVDAAFYYRGECHLWLTGQTPPLFRRVFNGWQALLREGCKHGGAKFASPLAICEMVKAQLFDDARKAWQSWLSAFGHLSFYSALVVIFGDGSQSEGGPWQKPDDYEAFGTLRFGFRRVSSYYHVAFTEILRWFINGCEEDLQLIIGGLGLLAARMRAHIFPKMRSDGRLCRDAVSYIGRKDGKIRVGLKSGGSDVFDRAILTSDAAAMRVLRGLACDKSFFSHDIRHALRTSPTDATTGLLMITERKFWLANNLPLAVFNEGRVQELYCLNPEPNRPEGPGVVLFHYALEDDAPKLLLPGFKKELCLELVREITAIFSNFAPHLVPKEKDYDQWVFLTRSADFYAGSPSKMNLPGQDAYTKRLFFQFQDAKHSGGDKGLYLAHGDRSFAGAWPEGAVQAGINAACAVIRSTGGLLLPGNPLDEMPNKYNY